MFNHKLKEKFFYLLKNKNNPYIFATTLLLLLLSIFIFATFFSVPSADDFCYAEVFKNKGFIESQVYWYMNWSGRYFANFLLSITPIDFNTLTYFRIILLSIQITIIISTFFFLKNLFRLFEIKINYENWSIFILSLLTALLNILLLPNPVENLYWSAGVLTYQISLILLILVATIIINEVRAKRDYNLLKLGIIIVIIFLLFGLNETIAIISIVINSLTIFFLLIQKRNVPKVLYMTLIVALISFSLVYIAPGNAIRSFAIDNPNEKNLLYAIPLTIKETVLLFIRFFSKAETLLTLFFVYIISENFYLNKKSHLNTITKLFFPFISVLTIFMGLFASIYISGQTPPFRIIGAIQFLMILLLSTSIIIYQVSINRIKTTININLFILLILLFIPVFLYSRNSNLLIKNLYYNDLYNYSTINTERDKAIQKCKDSNISNCPIPMFNVNDRGNIIHFTDIIEQDDHWVNLCVSKYYNFESVIGTK